jgi:hypothetical protein
VPYTLKKGSVVKIGGFPVELAEDVPVESASLERLFPNTKELTSDQIKEAVFSEQFSSVGGG